MLKRCGFIHTFIYSIAQDLFLCLELCPTWRCPGIKNFTVAGIQFFLSALSSTVLPIGYFLFCRSKKVNLMESFSLTKIHDILQPQYCILSQTGFQNKEIKVTAFYA
ncbi:hypothetical protein SAMN04487833_13520 [Sarcina sp. DSM 11001]|nr:hypothetical protein SAMN04487833_13520 [Sarcina sp. DSM 11001]